MCRQRIALLALMILAISAFNLPQKTIKGLVTDADTGKGMPGVSVMLKNTTKGSTTNEKGQYEIEVPDNGGVLIFSFIGYATKEIRIGTSNVINVKIKPVVLMDEVAVEEEVDLPVATEKAQPEKTSGIPVRSYGKKKDGRAAMSYNMAAPSPTYPVGYIQQEPNLVHNTEAYDAISENIFLETMNNPLSTFSIDVDAASYSNMRRFLNNGQRPPKDAVRIEEMVNYFNYDYAQPKTFLSFISRTNAIGEPGISNMSVFLISLISYFAFR